MNIKDDLKDLRPRKINFFSAAVGLLLGITIPVILMVFGFNWFGLLLVAVASVVGAKLIYNRLPLSDGGEHD